MTSWVEIFDHSLCGGEDYNMSRKTRKSKELDNEKPARRSARLDNEKPARRSTRLDYEKPARRSISARLDNEKPARRSTRLNNRQGDCPQSWQTLQRGKINWKNKRNINSCPAANTRSRVSVRLVESVLCCSKPDEYNHVTDEYSTDNSDSDRSCVKTLTYSSFDSTNSKEKREKTRKRSKALSNSHVDEKKVDKKRTHDNGGQRGSKEERSNGKVLRSLRNEKCYHLRSRSYRTPESGNEAPSVQLEEKITVAKKSQKKTKLEEKPQNENNRTHSCLDKNGPKLQASTKQSALNWDQENEVTEKSAGKDVKKLIGRDSNKRSIEKDVKKRKKTGTLARKRELRDMLEQQDEGYEDDAFEGTPFRNQKPLLKCKLSPVIVDTSMQSYSSTDTEFRTPFSRTPINRLRPAGPLVSGSSESDVMTPGLLNSVNRNNVDRYVNQLRRRKFRLGCKKMKSHTPVSKKHPRIIATKSFDFDTNSSAQGFTTRAESENYDDDDDYYWSDIE